MLPRCSVVICHLDEVNAVEAEPLEAGLHAGQGAGPGEVEHLPHLLLVPPHLPSSAE